MAVFESYYPKTQTGPTVESTAIAGLLKVRPVVIEDERGDFCVTWSEGFEAAGLPKLNVQQHNRAYNRARATRGIHAEPWGKYIIPSSGRFFAPIVDLRPESETFGRHEAFDLDPEHGIYVPPGCGNAYQALTDGVYSYYVEGKWHPGLDFDVVDCYDPGLAIDWPYPKEQAIMSPRDRDAAVSIGEIAGRYLR